MSELGTLPDEHIEPKSGLHLLFVDGGKKPNPPGQTVGEAAIGVALKIPSEVRVGEISKPIDPVPDPHVAEYQALIQGLELSRSHGIDYVAVFSDSRTLVNQLNNVWGHNTEHLKALCMHALGLLQNFKGTQVSWVPRAWNSEAHKEAERILKVPSVSNQDGG